MDRDTVVCDLDGTLANLSDRRHLVQGEKRDYDKFYEMCDKDIPNEWCVRLLTSLMDSGYRVVIVSARRQLQRQKTLAWMREAFDFPNHNVPQLVLLRPPKDSTEDKVLKKNWLLSSGLKPRILFVIDDRPKVIKMWREEGLQVLDCGSGVEF